MHTTTTLQIKGMTCASCVNHIEKDVGKMKGVHYVMVNFAINRAEVMYDPEIVSVKEIMSQIKRTGYKAMAEEEMMQENGSHRMPDGMMMSDEDHSAHAGGRESKKRLLQNFGRLFMEL